jgi:TRAP-type C4-dicarboxylate transport system permease large subunit
VGDPAAVHRGDRRHLWRLRHGHRGRRIGRFRRDSDRYRAGLFIVIAAFLFQYFLAVTQMSQLLADALVHLPVGPLGIVIAILTFYIVAGMVVDELAMMLLTIPIVFPIVTGLGFDPVWFGILVVVTIQIGLICPPVGIIVFIMNNMVPDIGLVNIYKGAMPFVIADIVWLALLVAFPSLSLFLVRLMG